MAAIESNLVDLSPERLSSASPSRSLTTSTGSPRHGQSPSQMTTAEVQNRRQQRHTKKLSINFPILLPPARGSDTPNSQSHHTASPTALAMHPMTHGIFFSPPSMSTTSYTTAPASTTLPMPLTPPSEEELLHVAGRARSKSRGHIRQESTSAEYLTLLASHERRVLELKEELARAETELTTLKRQWAVYEAGKKKNEVKGTPVRMGPVPRGHTRAASVAETRTGLGLTGIEGSVNDDKIEVERERLREIARERMMGRWTGVENGQAPNGATKKTGQRVFTNSRHTRTLSLLTSATNTRKERTGSLDSVRNAKSSVDLTHQSSIDTPPTTASPTVPSLSRTNSGLEGLNFGKTYKDLASAASRKNIPQALSPEQFVKQGKQMVDGVRDGLWTFFEDIRQATVGDEAITGANGGGVRRQNSTSNHGSVASGNGSGKPRLKRTMTDGSATTTKRESQQQKENDSSFWKEFGMDTPKSDKSKLNSKSNSKPKSKRLSTDSEKGKRPSLPGRWPSTKTGAEFTECCPKHGEGPGDAHRPSREIQDHDRVVIARKATSNKESVNAESQNHVSKSSTDSRNPPSLVSDDLLDEEDNNEGEDDEEEEEEEEGEGEEEDEGWDDWNSSTDPGSPQVGRKRKDGGGSREKKQKGEGLGRATQREVQWHDLMS